MSLHSDQREDEESISGSSEAKTDRYGFLLVNGDTNNDSSDDLSPELVRHREMKWINLMSQWDQVLEKKHSKIKTQCQKGIPASVRSKCWPLLCGATQRKQSNKDLYKTLASSPGQQSWIDVIKRDTDRQFPFHEMFQSKDSHGQQGLLQVLKVYTQFRPDEGYCQAQGPVAAVLLMHMPMEEAFWCLVQISELYLPGYYSPLLEGVLFDAAILFGVLKRTCPAAYKHMQKQGVEPLMFATDWLMCLYTRHLPFNTLLRIWDLFFCNGVRVLFQVAVVLVRRCLGEARQRRECEGQMETLERLRSVKGRIQQEQADGFIQEVCSVPLSLAELQRQTEKELEKWRKERPSSTFDPRDRFHGYHMIWEKGKETENIKKERQRGNLRVPVMRSHSSLSPVALRKKWRKRGSKTETEDWEEKEFTKLDSDEERRRASVCGVAGELRANTQEFNTHFQKERNTMANTQRISAMETDPVTDCNDTVFEEDENSVVVIAIPPHTHGGDHVEETRPSASLKEVDSQTAIIQQETRNKHSTEAWQVEEKKEQDDQDEEISTHQDQPEAQTQQEESQFSQIEDARNKLEEETQENKSKQEEETELETANPEEEEQLNINATEEEVNSIQQEVEVERNTDIKEKTEKENEINSDQEEEVEMGNSKQEEEIHLGTTIEVVICDSEIQEKEIKTKRIEHVVEIQEGKIEDAEEVEARNSKQEIEIQEPNEIKANNGKHELGNQEEKEMKANDREQEMKIQLEMGSKANNSEQEVEIVNGDQQANNANEEERLNLCLVHTIDVRTLKQQQQEDSERKIEDEETFQMEEETHLNAQTPEVRKDAVDVKGDPCESGNNTDRETIQQQQEGEREKEARITDTPDEETEETITEEEKRSSHNLTMAQDASNAVASSNIQQETAMKPSAQSETPQDSNKPQDENTDANKISEPERTTESKNPAPPQPDKKEVEAEAEIEFNVTPEPNLVKLPSGANQQPQLRLRRSSSSHTSYPTILSEDTFRNPQQSVERDSYPRTTNSPAESDIVQPKQTQRQNSKLNAPQKQSDKPKRKGLFQRLRADKPSIPKIVIQDFSEGEEKLSSKERRRRRRMQERKEKEEEKERKKLEKELGKEKTKERKKPQTRGKSFQVLSSKRDDDNVVTGRSSTQAAGRKRTSYSESYF